MRELETNAELCGCAFCKDGGDPALFAGSGSYARNYLYITCKKCWITTREFDFHECGENYNSNFDEVRAELIKHWNSPFDGR